MIQESFIDNHVVLKVHSKTMIQHSFRLSQNFALITVSGENSIDEFKEATTSFCDDANFSAGIHRVVDFTNASVDNISTLEFLSYVKFARVVPARMGTRIALIGSKQRGILWMFFDAMTFLNIKLFPNVEQAVDWVEEG